MSGAMIVSVPNGTDTPPDGGPASEPVSPPLVFLVGDDLDEIADVAADLESWGHDPIVQFDVSAIGNSITRVRPDVVVVIGTEVPREIVAIAASIGTIVLAYRPSDGGSGLRSLDGVVHVSGSETLRRAIETDRNVAGLGDDGGTGGHALDDDELLTTNLVPGGASGADGQGGVKAGSDGLRVRSASDALGVSRDRGIDPDEADDPQGDLETETGTRRSGAGSSTGGARWVRLLIAIGALVMIASLIFAPPSEPPDGDAEDPANVAIEEEAPSDPAEAEMVEIPTTAPEAPRVATPPGVVAGAGPVVAGSGISGVVVGVTGIPVPGAKVRAAGPSGVIEMEADEIGRWRMADVLSGRYAIEARTGELSGAAVEVLVGERMVINGVRVVVGPR